MQERLTEERRQLAEENLKLIHFAMKSLNIKYDYEDCYSAGCIGLCTAAARWDKHKGLAFTTYACYLIKNQIVNYMKTSDAYTRGRVSPCKELFAYEEQGFKHIEDKQLAAFILSNLDCFLDEKEAAVIRLVARGTPAAKIAKDMGTDVFNVYNLRKSAVKKISDFVKI